MKLIFTIFLLFSFIIVNAGWPVPKGCPLEWYEENEYCPSNYTIWKVVKGISNIKFTDTEYDKYWWLDSSIEKNYILWNNYFYTDKWLEPIKESFLIWEWWVYMWKINKWDVVIIDSNIVNYYNKNEEEIAKKTIKYLKIKIWFDWELFLPPSYWNYYKVTCKNDIISLSNESKEYDLWYQHNSIIDKKIWNKEKIRQKLQDDIKTCKNFNKLFDIKQENKEEQIIEKNIDKESIKQKSWFEKLIDFLKWIFWKIFG